MWDVAWGMRSFVGKKLMRRCVDAWMRGCVDAIQVRASRDFYMPPPAARR